MMQSWAKTVMKVLRFTRAERALAIAIFVVFQAVLPSYAGAISGWSDNDRFVICAEHGLIELADHELPVQSASDGTTCLIAQSMGFATAQIPVIENVILPYIAISALSPQQLQLNHLSQKFSPHAQRAPPVLISQS